MMIGQSLQSSRVHEHLKFSYPGPSRKLSKFTHLVLSKMPWRKKGDGHCQNKQEGLNLGLSVSCQESDGIKISLVG